MCIDVLFDSGLLVLLALMGTSVACLPHTNELVDVLVRSVGSAGHKTNLFVSPGNVNAAYVFFLGSSTYCKCYNSA